MDLPERFRVAFVGGKERGEDLRERASSRGVHVGVASAVTDVPGLYLLLAPDVVVLDDDCPELAWESYTQLSSVGARPLVVLAREDMVEEWREATDEDTIILDPCETHEDLLETLARISERIPSLFTMDTHLSTAPNGRASTEVYHGR